MSYGGPGYVGRSLGSWVGNRRLVEISIAAKQIRRRGTSVRVALHVGIDNQPFRNRDLFSGGETTFLLTITTLGRLFPLPRDIPTIFVNQRGTR